MLFPPFFFLSFSLYPLHQPIFTVIIALLSHLV